MIIWEERRENLYLLGFSRCDLQHTTAGRVFFFYKVLEVKKKDNTGKGCILSHNISVLVLTLKPC